MTIVHHHDSFISQSGKTVYGKLSFFSLFSLFVQQPSLQPSTSDFLGAHYISQHAVLCQPDSTSPQKHMFASQASSQQVKYYTITNISRWSQLQAEMLVKKVCYIKLRPKINRSLPLLKFLGNNISSGKQSKFSRIDWVDYKYKLFKTSHNLFFKLFLALQLCSSY